MLMLNLLDFLRNAAPEISSRLGAVATTMMLVNIFHNFLIVVKVSEDLIKLGLHFLNVVVVFVIFLIDLLLLLFTLFFDFI